ncbi:neprilysin-1-like [Amblyomma americanum]
MNAYDVAGIQYDDNEQLNPWITKNARARYISRALCLRESHAKARRSVHKVSSLDDFVDSENIGDLVGAATAYQALRSLPSDQRTQTLPGLNLTADQLYFVGRCMTLCKRDSRKSSGRYASPRARCNVPAMNMAAFSSAFGCRITAPMNPYSKCSFWM